MLVPIAAVRIINHALYSSHQRTPGFTISVLYYLCVSLRLSVHSSMRLLLVAFLPRYHRRSLRSHSTPQHAESRHRCIPVHEGTTRSIKKPTS